jgi:hypothetical protein
MPSADSVPLRGTVALNQPVAVYNNWSAYDELSDNIELTEKLALNELDQIVRLRQAGVRIDYYLMDAFWYATNGGYRLFRKPNWPDGPDRWMEACRANHVKPGLWFTSNVPFRLNVLPEWQSSMDVTGSALIEASQGDHNLAVHINYDRPLWSGLSWGVGEIRNRDFDRHLPVRVRCVSLDPLASDLALQLYAVEYAKHIR